MIFRASIIALACAIPAMAELKEYSASPGAIFELRESGDVAWNLLAPIDLEFRTYKLANGDSVFVFAPSKLTVVTSLTIDWDNRQFNQNTHRIVLGKPSPEPGPGPGPGPQPPPTPPGPDVPDSPLGLGSLIYKTMHAARAPPDVAEKVASAFDAAAKQADSNGAPLYKPGRFNETDQNGTILWTLRLAVGEPIYKPWHDRFVLLINEGKLDDGNGSVLHGSAEAFRESSEYARKWAKK